MKASRAISGEMVLEKLLERLLKLLIEDAGAVQGLLLLEEDGQFKIEAGADKERMNVLESLPLENTEMLSAAIVNYVVRTQEALVLSDAAADSRFSADDYIAVLSRLIVWWSCDYCVRRQPCRWRTLGCMRSSTIILKISNVWERSRMNSCQICRMSCELLFRPFTAFPK